MQSRHGVSKKKSFLTATLNQGEVTRAGKALFNVMASGGVSIDEWKAAKLGAAIEDANPLQMLVRDIEGLITAAGCAVPAGPDEKTPVELELGNVIDGLGPKVRDYMQKAFSRVPPVSNVAVELEGYFTVLVKVAGDTQTTLWRAYRSAKLVEELISRGMSSWYREAADELVAAATSLARGAVGVVTDSRKRGGVERHARDPKTEAKASAFKLWQERRAGKLPKLRTNEQFAIECMRRWPVLTSAATITRWCTAWGREFKTHPAS